MKQLVMMGEEEEESTVIAIDTDKNSQHAVKWAVENLLNNNSSCTLIHVRTRSIHHSFFLYADDDFQALPPTQEELHHFFLPFRGFCARKGIVAKELVLHDNHVSNALTHYIINNSIHNIVVGASRWNALIRKFKDADVPTSLVKSVPESCMVHIISKGKVQNIRPAGRSQNISIAPTKSLKDFNRKSFKYGLGRGSSNGRVCSGQNKDANSPKLPDCSSQNSSKRSSLTGDTSHENQHVVHNADTCTCRTKSSKNSPKREEIEISKLKLEPKRKSKKYREAAAAKQKVEKFRQEEGNIEECRLAEEALAEVERQKEILSKRLAEMQEEEERNRAFNGSAHNRILFKRYNIKEIEVATNYFDSALQIGEGAYGPVFKGVLDDTDVAVKALRPDLSQGEKQFQQEVNVLSTIKHPNMVRLLGACPEYGCLVYEYMENGSLEDRLFQKDNTPTIPWKVRFKIASEIGSGLLFLHQRKPEPVVHRDLKPANILLDKKYASKITDVGLARLVPPSVADKTTEYHKTTAAGTFCYIDPEYQQTGLLGVKSDIYSLGVMLLQIITGKPPMGVAHLVQEAITNGNFLEVLDPNVTDWPLQDTLSFAILALKCCEMRRRDRPDLASVILPELIRLRNLG
ncbi:U-box domain-containing protein 51, partial [Mucuna pruriens]